MNIATLAEQRPMSVRSMVLVSLVGTLCFGGILWHHSRAEAELMTMPAQERLSLYDRTLSTLSTTCAHAEGESLREFCQQQAMFLSRFPECDGSCQSACQRYLPRPTK